jgi:signal transduction histidine kinase
MVESAAGHGGEVAAGTSMASYDEQLRDLEAELEKTRRARQRFFWAVSHQLRTPLNVILCYNDLLASGVLGPLNEKQEQAATRMAASISQLKQLVEGVFELSEIESRTVPVAENRVELRALAEAIAAELSPIAHAKGLFLRVEGEAGVAVVTDGTKLRRILLNLCGNALHLTNEGGVTLRVSAAQGGVRIDVVDTGHGLDEAERDRIFEEFAQVAPAERHAGLNLALAHRLALLLGAEIEVDSRKGHGSVFSLRLPLREEVAAGG